MSPPQKRYIGDDAYKAERGRLLLAFAEKLRAERERRNLSQKSLAEIANVHRTQGLFVPTERKAPTHSKGRHRCAAPLVERERL